MSRHTVTRRSFIGRATALAVAGASAPAWMKALAARPEAEANLAASATPGQAEARLELAEWSYFWVGVERAELARGTVVNGKQMYVEYMTPAQVRHPFSIVMVHGGGGQGLDWLGTPDGRPGWATYLVQEGFKVYVVDRPGHGRSPFHPDLHGPFEAHARTYEEIVGEIASPEKDPMPYGPQARLHTQWPGSTGTIGDPILDQAMASGGGSFLADLERTHIIWQQRGAELLDKIGPAIFITHSAGGPFAWLCADARPRLVKGIVAMEPSGPPFGQRQATGRGTVRWGVTASRMTYDPPVSDPAEIKTQLHPPDRPGDIPYLLQAEPARQLVNLRGIPIALFTTEASYHVPYDGGTAAFLKQAGCSIEHIRLADRGVHGNVHAMMKEKNNREVLQPIIEWIVAHTSPSGVRAPATKRSTDSTALTLSDKGFFWLGPEPRKMAHGTIVTGQMYVEYLIPAERRHEYPVVLVHGGGGSMLEYMGLGDGVAGWAHYYVKEGYAVYLVDRPGHGRSPYHPDALGPIGPHPTYAEISASLRRAATGPNRRWAGSGDIGDALLDQFMAGQNAPPMDQALAHSLWASRGAMLLDKIGPAVVHTHAAGGPFGWLVADRRPNLVKAIVCVEGAASPFQTPWGLASAPLTYDPPVSNAGELTRREVKPPAGSSMPSYNLQAEPARKLKNLQGIPIVVVTSERSGRTQDKAGIAFLQQAGCTVEDLQLKDRGILGNGHYMMIESNRRQVFDVIRGWIEQKVAVKA